MSSTKPVTSILLLSNSVWAGSTTETPKVETSPRPDTHESEKNNSLFHGALAKQGVNINIRINSASEVDYSRTPSMDREHNSLFGAAFKK